MWRSVEDQDLSLHLGLQLIEPRRNCTRSSQDLDVIERVRVAPSGPVGRLEQFDQVCAMPLLFVELLSLPLYKPLDCLLGLDRPVLDGWPRQ